MIDKHRVSPSLLVGDRLVIFKCVYGCDSFLVCAAGMYVDPLYVYFVPPSHGATPWPPPTVPGFRAVMARSPCRRIYVSLGADKGSHSTGQHG